jgi:hypothetical protein
LLIELEKINGFDCTWECHNAPKVLTAWINTGANSVQNTNKVKTYKMTEDS